MSKGWEVFQALLKRIRGGSAPYSRELVINGHEIRADIYPSNYILHEVGFDFKRNQTTHEAVKDIRNEDVNIGD